MRAIARIHTAVAGLLLATAALCSCHTIDDDRIPAVPVHIEFPTVAQWNIYGVAGATDYRYFILEKRQPSNFPYTAMSYTGYGGVLLVSDVLGNPKAFDMSCPVECKRDIRVEIDTEKMLARCPHCGSTYDVFSLAGHPVAGPAAEKAYGLRNYYVGPGRGGAYMLISF